MPKGFQTLKGFRDFFPDECSARNYIFEAWRHVAKRYGFVEYEGPILEPTDLYRKKSGNEIVGQLFCFTDKGDRDVSMRPELTPTLARMAAARQRDFKKPMRWFSIGQFFRYEKHQKGRGREFYQFNCDIIGQSEATADAELAALSVDIMRELGFTQDDFRLRISDRQAWADFADKSGVGEDQLPEFLQIVDKMERTRSEVFAEKLAQFNLTPDDIHGFIASGVHASETLITIVEDLQARGLAEYVEVDLSIVRGLAYYTGAVFEIFDIGKGMRAVAGGGRYDQLLDLIGGVDLPACGFAMGDMVITDLVRESDVPNKKLEAAVTDSQSVDAYVVIVDEMYRNSALRVIQALRDDGIKVGYSMSALKMGKQFQTAEQMGAKYGVVIGGEFPKVTVKTLADRSENEVDESDLVESLILK